MYSIETCQLTKRYGNSDVVAKLNLTVPEGAVYGFLGPNGAGKTTTMKLLLGLIHPTGGRITLLGKELNEKNRLNLLKQVGSLIESPSYYGHLTAEENLEIVARLRGLDREEIGKALKLVGLTGTGRKTVAKFSLGMKQRLGIAAALMGRPRLVLLDEPTNGLDPAGVIEMRELIADLPKKSGMTVLVSSHLLSEIERMADHVGIIRGGRLCYQDSMEKLKALGNHSIALRTSDNDRAGALLSCRAADGYLLLPWQTDAELSASMQRLYEAGVTPLRIVERQERLEDIFMRLTGMEV